MAEEIDWARRFFDQQYGSSPDPQLIEAQAPVARPDPIVRPGEDRAARPRPKASPQTQAAPPAEPTPTPPVSDEPPDWSERAFRPANTPEKPPPPFPGYKPTDDEGWAEWFANNVRGRKDPRYKDLPSFEDAMMAEGSEPLLRGTRVAMPFVGSDTGMANIAKSSLGDRHIRTESDAWGAPVLVYKGKDGAEKKAYLNRPGLDGEDVARGIMQAVPYALTGGAAGAATAGTTALTRMAAQGITGAATNLATDVTGLVMGSEEAPNLTQSGIVGGIAAGVEGAAGPIGRVIRAFRTVPGLIDNAGKLTPKGTDVAKAAGFDIPTMTKELTENFSKEFARTGRSEVGATSRLLEFDIPTTKGRITKDPGQLWTEEAIRRNVFGSDAKATIDAITGKEIGKEGLETKAIEAAARGDSTVPTSIAGKLSPGTTAKDATPNSLGTSIRSGLDEAKTVAEGIADDAWKKVGKIVPHLEAMAELPGTITRSVGDLPLNKSLTPVAVEMDTALGQFMKGEAPNEGLQTVQRAVVQDVDGMRRKLGNMLGSVAKDNQTDRAAAAAIMHGFSDWMQNSAELALKSGNVANAAALRTAIDRTREMKTIFAPSSRFGGSDKAGAIIKHVMSAEGEMTPESIIAKMFTQTNLPAPKPGSVEAIRLIEQGLKRYLPPERAANVWGDLKLANWKRMIETPRGELHTPAMMAKNIDLAFNKQTSVMNALHTNEEKALMLRWSAAMKDLAYKEPNASGTSYGNAWFASKVGQVFMKVIGAETGPLSRISAVLMSPAKKVVGQVAARGAANPKFNDLTPVLGGYGGFAGSRTNLEGN